MGKDLKSSISRKLGRAPFIIIYDSVSGKYDSFENPGFIIQDGSGQKSTEIILKNNLDVLLVEEIGRKAYSVLQKEHVKIQLLKAGGTVKSSINRYLKKSRDLKNSLNF
jgi:predicted Fe-Mo cluster-binding NifX family protein